MTTINNTTFNNIIDKIINFKNNIFSPKYKFDGVDGIYKIVFKMLYDNKNNTYKSKFHFIKFKKHIIHLIDLFFFINIKNQIWL